MFNLKPTLDFYSYLQSAFDFFNKELFDGKLSPVMFTITRKKRVCGYFRNDAWVTENGQSCHEIAVNPAYFITASPLEIYQTIAHEQAHQYIHQYGKPSRNGYHSREWANLMIDIGLMPVAKNGGVTGQAVGDKPIAGGRFERACIEFFKAGYKLALVDKQYSSNITLKRLNKIIHERITTGTSLSTRLKENLSTIDEVNKGKPNYIAPTPTLTADNSQQSLVDIFTNTASEDDDSHDDALSDLVSMYGDNVTSADNEPTEDMVSIALVNESGMDCQTITDYDAVENYEVDLDSDSATLHALSQPINEFFDINPYQNRPESPIKTSYQCPTCKYKVWGRMNLRIGCLTCGDELIIVKPGT